MRRLRLKYPNDLVLDGQEWILALTFRAELERRRAREVPVEVTVQLTRPNIACLLGQIAKMHKRDRARLAEEARRISREIATLEENKNG
jgi:hypothetical protein